MSSDGMSVSLLENRDLQWSTLDSRLPLSESVFQALSKALRAGVFRPGDRLREEEIASRLQVSRTPVREAFGRLAAKRLVVPGGGRGLIVRRLEPTEVFELYAMREILEGAAARLAAQHISPLEIEILQDIETLYEASTQEPEEMALINRRFHEAIVLAARNGYLDSALQELQDGVALLGPTTFTVPGRPADSITEHKAILAAIISRHPDEAEKMARTHIREALRTRLKLL